MVSLALFLGCQPAAEQNSRNLDISGRVSEKELLVVDKSTQQDRNLLYKDDPTVSYCEASLETTDRQPKFYSGFRDFKLYRSASLSKIFVTAWAINRLGAQYQFKQTWSVIKNKDKSFDVYFDSGGDPVFNIEKIQYALSQLSKSGLQSIRNLYVSPNTRIYLSVLSNPHAELKNVPVTAEETIDNLKLVLNSKNWAQQTLRARENILAHAKMYRADVFNQLKLAQKFSVDKVLYDFDSQYKESFKNAFKIQIHSAPLYKYLKEINLSSNNYLSDALFSLLGGEKGFLTFQRNVLGLEMNHVYMRTGSGLPKIVQGQRYDNLASCYGLMRAIHFVKLAADQNSVNLGQLLLTAGLDLGGTYTTDYKINRSVVVKTGRLYEYPTLNLAGAVSTHQGLIAFAFLGHDFNNQNENIMKQKRDHLLNDVLSFYKEKPYFSTIENNTIFFSY
ncbi:MAG: D-alanyl-D-alanine carboxypeptidase [Pseudobdellovibrio sp.]